MSKDKTFRVVIEMTVKAPGLEDRDMENIKVHIADRVKQIEHWNYWFSSHINNIKIEDM